MLLRIICFQWDNTTNLFTNTETFCHAPTCTTIPKRSPSSNVTTTTTTTTTTSSTSTTCDFVSSIGGRGNGGAEHCINSRTNGLIGCCRCRQTVAVVVETTNFVEEIVLLLSDPSTIRILLMLLITPETKRYYYSYQYYYN